MKVLYLFLLSFPLSSFSTDTNEVGYHAGISSLEDADVLSDLWPEFHDWALKYQKVYSTLEEKYDRMKVWAQNHRKFLLHMYARTRCSFVFSCSC